MNKLTGIIENIINEKELSIVEVKVNNDIFSSIILESPQTANYLTKGNQVTLLFKETEVSIAKNLSGSISIRNRVTTVISGIEKGKVLTKIILDYSGTKLVSVITTGSAERLELKAGEKVEALVKTNEITILPE